MLLRVEHILKIEVEYTEEGADWDFWSTSSKEEAENPTTTRFYRVHLGRATMIVVKAPQHAGSAAARA
jgi:hypothetical protein